MKSYFHKLLEADSQPIVNIGIYDPVHYDPFKEESFEKFWQSDAYRIWEIPLYSEKSTLDLINGNHEKEAGNSAILGEPVSIIHVVKAHSLKGCGGPNFDNMLRKSVSSSDYRISFIGMDFQPDDPGLVQIARF